MEGQVPQQRRRSHNHHDADLPRSHAWLTLTCMRDPKQYYRTAPAAKAGLGQQCQLVIESWRVVQTAVEELIAQDLTFCMQFLTTTRSRVAIIRCHPRDVQAPPASSACHSGQQHLDSGVGGSPGALPGTAPQSTSGSLDVCCIHTKL